MSQHSGEPLTPQLPDTEVFFAMPSDSETVILSFGAKGGGHGHFHFMKLLRPLPDISKLLVRDPAGNWYNTGLPGVGDTLEEIAARIEQEVAQLGGSRVISSGSSMGAYAAILFGCLLDAERVIALGPQTLLDPGLRHAPPADVPLQAPDLEPIIRAAPRTKIDLVAGWDDHVDVFHAQRVAHLPSVRVLAVRQGVHSFVTDLHDEGKLMPLIGDLIAGRTPDLCDVDPHLEPDVERRIGETAFAVNRGDWEAVVERIGPVADSHPEWAGPNFDLGRALTCLGDWPAAEAANARALRANPRWVQPRAYLIKSLFEQGRPDEVEEIARTGLAKSPEWAYGHLSLARCLVRLGRTDEARSPAARAGALDPKLTKASQDLFA